MFNKQTLKNLTTCAIATVLAISFLACTDRAYSVEMPTATPADCITTTQAMELTAIANQLSDTASKLEATVDALEGRLEDMDSRMEAVEAQQESDKK
ncbi:hypothetical protein [Aeromonas sanarellii]|uniref:hypothetical protein n=1 Tax=Aeromonas sanarellii TaxID=633415 RepID=UPI0038D239D1